MKSITQDMKFRYSLMKYAEKHGVAQASRRYNKSRSYIYFWKARFDGSIESLACESRRPHHHPNLHTKDELQLICNMHRRNPRIGVVELWARLRKRGYTRCVESLWRVLRREGMAEKEEPRPKYKPKPYEQMQRPGRRIQIDVKVVPRSCIAGSAAEAVPVHRHRRILTLSDPGSLSRAKHLFICRFSSQGGRRLCLQRREGRMCADR